MKEFEWYGIRADDKEYRIGDICELSHNWWQDDPEDGDISLYLDEPDKNLLTEIWHGKEYEFTLFNNLFPFIKWQDKEPIRIKEVLDNCIVENIKEEQ